MVSKRDEKGGIKLIVFDFDGVFASTKQGYLHYFKETFARHGWKLNYRDIESALGPKSHTVIEILAKMKKGDPLALKMAYESDTQLIRHGMGFVKVREQVIDTLTALKRDRHLALRTNSRKAFVSSVMEKFHIKTKFYSFFDAVATAEDKLDKEVVIRRFMKQFHSSPRETIYVGD